MLSSNKIVIQTSAEALTRLCFLADDSQVEETGCEEIITRTRAELSHWFDNPDFVFTIPLAPPGTPFQQKVWSALRLIPRGETRTYGELARQLYTSARAIGNACRQNPIPVIIPCHRVIGRKNMGGYAGATTGKLMQIKQWLLQHEKGNSIYAKHQSRSIQTPKIQG